MTVFSTPDGRRRAALAAARIFMGLLFLSVWSYNLQHHLYSTSGYADFVQIYADDTTTPFMASILNHVVIPHAAIFSKLQMVTELVLIGVPLTLGLFTPVAGLIGTGFAIPLGLAANGKPGEWSGTYMMIVLLLVIVAVTQAGRTWGVDARLARKRPHPRLPVY
jgi:uncharacterized membrane protein YphA (DoxX/SURF4 family)